MIAKSLNRTCDSCVSVSLEELLQLSRPAKELSLSALRSNSSLAGQHASRLMARGMEFAESRRYQTGDDIRNIDWRVTARTGRTHTKLFAAEKERPVLFAVDRRSPMFFATQGVFKSVQASLMTGYLAWSASLGCDRLGGVVFDDETLEEYRPALGKRGLLPLLNGVSKGKGKLAGQQKAAQMSTPVMDRALSSLRQMATPGSLIFIVSDFRNLSSYGVNLIQQLSAESDLCLCFIYDPFEADLPAGGVYPVTHRNRELKLNTFDRLNVERYRQQFIERRETIQSLGKKRRTHVIECLTHDNCLDVLRTHFH